MFVEPEEKSGRVSPSPVAITIIFTTNFRWYVPPRPRWYHPLGPAFSGGGTVVVHGGKRNKFGGTSGGKPNRWYRTTAYSIRWYTYHRVYHRARHALMGQKIALTGIRTRDLYVLGAQPQPLSHMRARHNSLSFSVSLSLPLAIFETTHANF